MRLVTLLASLLLTFQTFGQNIILPNGEYMDTTSNIDTICKNYNAYYYQVGGKYPESSSSILKQARTFLQKNNKRYPGNGYITFRFIVDCEGKIMKKIQVLQTDEMYKPYHFSKDLVNELFLFFNTMQKWKIAKTKQGDVFNYFAFIAFKINNGEVINIIP